MHIGRDSFVIAVITNRPVCVAQQVFTLFIEVYPLRTLFSGPKSDSGNSSNKARNNKNYLGLSVVHPGLNP